VVTQILVGTIVLGSVYSLVVIGMVVLFRATKIISFTQGGFMALGAFLFYALAQRQPLALAFVEAVVAMGILGGVVYPVLFRRLAGSEHFIVIIATLGLNVVLATAIPIIWGPEPRLLPTDLSRNPFRILGGSLVFTPAHLITVVAAFVVIGILISTLQRTITGLQMRAVADQPLLSLYLGINVDWIAILAWAIAAGTAAVAGIVMAMGNSVDEFSIASLGLVAFPAMMLGGLDSIRGALVGGLALALIENVVALVFGGEWTAVGAYAVLLVILLLRPSGLFGSRSIARV
jgi:branched-chain amino acid transport system permease protein